MVEDEGFVRRWSRRKEEARREPLAKPVADTARRSDDRGNAAVPAEPGAAPNDEPRSVVDDLPEIEKLRAESDFTVFLQDGVPEELRRTALRHLWRLDPVFANLDGLLEYGEDYTDAVTVVENLKTAYQVGRGFIDSEEESAEVAEEVAEPSQDSDIVPAGESASESAGKPGLNPDIDDGRGVAADGTARGKSHRS
jgi:hypothetical protein